MYVKIIDAGECFSTTKTFINGVCANRDEWEKHNFYPQTGMVGEVVERTTKLDAYIVKIMDNIYVPMTSRGIKEITYQEYQQGQSKNVCSGMNQRQQNINRQYDEFMDLMARVNNRLI